VKEKLDDIAIIPEYELRLDILCQYGASAHPSTHRALRDQFSVNGKIPHEKVPEIKELQSQEKKSSRKMIVKFLTDWFGYSATWDLYVNFLKRQPEKARSDYKKRLNDIDSWIKSGIPSPECQKSMRDQIVNDIDIEDVSPCTYSTNRSRQWAKSDQRINEYYFTDEDEFCSPSQGLILNQNILIDKDRHSLYFLYFFTYMLKEVIQKEKFLDYHLWRSFDNDLKSYRSFLIACTDNVEMSDRLQKLIDEWLDNNLDIPSSSNKKRAQSTFDSEIGLIDAPNPSPDKLNGTDSNKGLRDLFKESAPHTWDEIFDFLSSDKASDLGALLTGTANQPLMVSIPGIKMHLTYIFNFFLKQRYFKLDYQKPKDAAAFISSNIEGYDVTEKTLSSKNPPKSIDASFITMIRNRFK
jgi:hypothetical protein